MRVLLDGAWGFAASPHKNSAEIERIVALAIDIAKGSRLCQLSRVQLVPAEVYRERYITPLEIDPFTVPITEKADLLLSLNEQLLSYSERGIKKAYSYSQFAREDKTFASTAGSVIEQTIYRSYAHFGCTGDAFWKVEKGKVVGMLKDVTYHAMTTDFWNRVDALGPASERQQCGTNICGKGEPIQLAQMTHSCVPVRVRDIQIDGLS